MSFLVVVNVSIEATKIQFSTFASVAKKKKKKKKKK